MDETTEKVVETEATMDQTATEAPVEDAAEQVAEEASDDSVKKASEPAAKEVSDNSAKKAAEPASMKDMEKELEASYKMMGDGEHDTDTLLAWKKIMELYEAKETLEVEITGVVGKGAIALVEGIRGFIPVSRLSLQHVNDVNDWLGKKIRVRIITADQAKDKLVLSAREILREERDEQKKLKISAIEVGSVFTGKVESLQPYGAFVDLGDGISGLVHVSQISTERVKQPSDVLKEGQEVQVKVIGKQDGKLKLSMKALMVQKKRDEEVKVAIPKAESIGTSIGDLLKNLKL